MSRTQNTRVVAPPDEKTSLQTELTHIDKGFFTGFAYDPNNITQKFSVELLVDGLLVAVTVAHQMVLKLTEANIGDGQFGFTFHLSDEVISDAQVVEARLANLSVPVGHPIHCAEYVESPETSDFGELEWVGGLRFNGWLSVGNNAAIEIAVDQRPIMQIKPSGWTHIERDGGYQAASRLDFHLPARFADGCVRSLTAKSADGINITPQPLTFVAFEDGLERSLARLGEVESERLRGKLFDLLLPASLPFSLYDDWKARFPAIVETTALREAAIILIGDKGVDETAESLEAQDTVAWTATSIPSDKGVTRFDPQAARDFLGGEASDSDFVVFCLSGTIFSNIALQRIAEAFDVGADCRCVYGDVDIQTDRGTLVPLMLPALDRERALEQGYAALLFALRREDAIAALEQSKSLYDLLGQVLGEHSSPNAFRHIPGAIAALPRFDVEQATRELAEAASAQLEKNGVEASIEESRTGLLPAVRIRRKPSSDERTTIIIPTRNRVSLVRKCVESILPALDRSPAKILIVDNDSNDPETLEFLADAPSRGIDVITVPGYFNFSRINNIAARHSVSARLCLLNNDIQAIDSDWLAEMSSRLEDPTVGAVGSLLIWPSGVIQHGGVVLGANFAATHCFNERVDGDPGYGDLLRVAHECSAVTAACMLLRRADYLAAGGMDEVRFPVNFNDVDLCLKLRARGQRIVFTPHAKLLHLESASRGKDEAIDRKARFNRELLSLRTKWGQCLIDDPFYSPMLSLDSTPFSALAWPPRSWKSRISEPPWPLELPEGF